MRVLVATAAIAGTCVLAGCSKQPPTTTEMYSVVVGEKTDLYEVVGRNELKLAANVKVKAVQGPGGSDSGMLVLRANGTTGGYMACSCPPGCSGTCKAANDNPDHASCSGGCSNSEGVGVSCEMYGPLPGPPKDPLTIKLVHR
jgi:hypothetical protein